MTTLLLIFGMFLLCFAWSLRDGGAKITTHGYGRLLQVEREERDKERREEVDKRYGNATKDSPIREIRDRAATEHADGVLINQNHTTSPRRPSNFTNARKATTL